MSTSYTYKASYLCNKKMQKRVVLIGGTGLIGGYIQKILEDQSPNILLFIGSREKTQDHYLKIDVNNPLSFDAIEKESIDLAILCTEDPSNHVLKYCIENSIDYIDVTKPSESLIEAYEIAKSKNINSKIIFSSGWMGGIIPALITNNDSTSSIEEIRILIYYSLKDKAGKSSADFMAKNISKAFPVYTNNKPRFVKHFENKEKYRFLFNNQEYSLYNFDIPDIYILNQIEKTLNISAKITYSSNTITQLLAIIQKINIFKMLPLSTRKKIFYSSGAGDQTAFEVIKKDRDGNKSQISLVCLQGQAYLTALAISLHIKQITYKSLPNQIYFSHQLYTGSEFMEYLKKDKQIKIRIK